MIYGLGYSIYSSQNPSTSVSPPLTAKEKGPLSDLENHGWQQNPWPELIRGSDTPLIAFGSQRERTSLWPREPWMSTESMTWNNQRKWLTRIMPYWLGYSIYSSKNPSTSVSPSLAAKEKRLPSDIEIHALPQNPWPEIIRGSDKPGLCFIGLGTVYIAPKILVLVSVFPWQPKRKVDEHRIHDLN